MTGLNLHTVTIAIMLTVLNVNMMPTVFSVHGSRDWERQIRTNEISQTRDSDVDFHISSNVLTWSESVDECYKHGGLLANLDVPREREALILALRFSGNYEGARFWIWTCRYGVLPYCSNQCTEVTYTKKGGLVNRLLSGADCNVKKRYICES